MLQISRACAAIDILDNYINGIPIEKALKEWFRNNRFAGSNDRRSIRDIIFDILRKRLILFYPFQINDYSENGRILVLSYLYIYKRDTFSLCDIVDNKYFLPPIKNKELLILNKINDYIKKAPKNILLGYPEFLEKKLKTTLGNDFEKVMKIFLERAPIYLRINNLKTNLKDEKSNLEKENIICEYCSASKSALRIKSGEQFLKKSSSYQLGNVELQDLSSQLTTEVDEISPGKRILDLCAGSGGKSLAIASKLKNNADIFAHDVNKLKLSNLLLRSNRAGARIKIIDSSSLNKYENFFDIVFIDAPCSGTGTWRRDPKTKWEITYQKIKTLSKNQYKIIKNSCRYLKKSGFLIYVVCSLLEDEGELVVKKFLMNNQKFSLVNKQLYYPINASDGFFFAILEKR